MVSNESESVESPKFEERASMANNSLPLKPSQVALGTFAVLTIVSFSQGDLRTLEPTLWSWVIHFGPAVAVSIFFATMLSLTFRIWMSLTAGK